MLKKILKITGGFLIALILAATFLPVSTVSADATNKYWVGGTGNWSDAANHWADSSGGAPGAGNLPTSATNVWFDANSFSGAGQTVTVDATANCLNLSFLNATNSPKFKSATGISTFVYGDATFIAAMSTESTGDYIFFRGADSHLTTNGLTFNQGIAMGLADKKLTLLDNLATTFRVYFTVGTIDTNGKTITITGATATDMYLDGAGAKTLTLGSSILNIKGWTYIGSTLTMTANTATINISGNCTNTNSLNFNGATVNLTGATSTITGSNTFNTLGLTRADVQTITFTAGTTQTVTNFTRNAGTQIKTLQSSNPGLQWSITKAGAGYIDLDYLSISRSTASPDTRVFYAGANSTNVGNNTGWIFTVPAVPTVTVSVPTHIHAEYADGIGTLTDKGAGNANALSIGFDWGLVDGVWTDSIEVPGSYNLGAFGAEVSPIVPFTVYFYRAKALNGAGWGYSASTSFTSLPIHPPINFSVSPNGEITWVNDEDATGTLIVRGTAGYPTDDEDGVIVYNGAGITTIDQNPNPESVTYYYSAWGYDGIYFSQLYSTDQNGGTAVAAIGNYIFYGIVLFVAVILTVGAYAVKRTALAALAAVIWMVVCGVSLSQLSTNVPIYTAMALVGLFGGIGMSIQAYGFRDKDEDGSEDDEDLTFEEKLKRSQTQRAEERAARNASSLDTINFKNAKRKAKEERNYFGS